MQLVYISRGINKKEVDINPLGTEKKIFQQITSLKKLGIGVTHMCPQPCTSNRVLNFILSQIIPPIDYLIARKSFDQNTIVYIRREYHHLSYLPLVITPRKYKVVFETQTIERLEYLGAIIESNKIKWLSVYNYCCMLLFERYLKSNADGIVSVTHEIGEHNKQLTKGKLHYLTLGNGIDTEHISVRLCPKYEEDILNILCVANVNYWHGLDRLLHSFSTYSGPKTIYLHVVGEGPELPNLKNLTKNLHLEDRVIFHGFKSGQDLDAMFDRCHIAIGSLGGFRLNMHEMSSLKSGEYCARGIPFIIAATAVDFPKEWDYILHVPETEEPIDMESVVAFADKVCSDPDHVKIMREYAESHLDWLIKMKILKEFLEGL